MTRPADDEGFTVIELIIAMVLMIILMGPLVSAFVIGLGTTHASERDATNSADAQLLAGFLDTDVSSAQTVGVTSSCGGTGTFLTLKWSDGGTSVEASYRAVADAARQAELQLATPVYTAERVQCGGTGAGTSVVARSLLAVPTVTCDGVPCSASTTTPRRVTLTGQESAVELTDIAATDRYSLGVTATRKVTP